MIVWACEHVNSQTCIQFVSMWTYALYTIVHTLMWAWMTVVSIPCICEFVSMWYLYSPILYNTFAFYSCVSLWACEQNEIHLWECDSCEHSLHLWAYEHVIPILTNIILLPAIAVWTCEHVNKMEYTCGSVTCVSLWICEHGYQAPTTAVISYSIQLCELMRWWP